MRLLIARVILAVQLTVSSIMQTLQKTILHGANNISVAIATMLRKFRGAPARVNQRSKTKQSAVQVGTQDQSSKQDLPLVHLGHGGVGSLQATAAPKSSSQRRPRQPAKPAVKVKAAGAQPTSRAATPVQDKAPVQTRTARPSGARGKQAAAAPKTHQPAKPAKKVKA